MDLHYLRQSFTLILPLALSLILARALTLVLCCAVLRCAVLCYAVPCCAVLRCAVLCCAVLHSIFPLQRYMALHREGALSKPCLLSLLEP